MDCNKDREIKKNVENDKEIDEDRERHKENVGERERGKGWQRGKRSSAYLHNRKQFP